MSFILCPQTSFLYVWCVLPGKMDSKKKKKSSDFTTFTVGSCRKEDALTYRDGESGELTGQRRYVRRRGRRCTEKEEPYSNTCCRKTNPGVLLCVLCVSLGPWVSALCSVLCHRRSMHVMKTCCLQACAMSGVVVIFTKFWEKWKQVSPSSSIRQACVLGGKPGAPCPSYLGWSHV